MSALRRDRLLPCHLGLFSREPVMADGRADHEVSTHCAVIQMLRRVGVEGNGYREASQWGRSHAPVECGSRVSGKG